MDVLLTTLLSGLSVSEHPTIARYLEPHLPLIKSRTLNAFYHDLRYQKKTYVIHLSFLEEEAILDYRLRSVLERLIEWIMNQKKG